MLRVTQENFKNTLDRIAVSVFIDISIDFDK